MVEVTLSRVEASGEFDRIYLAGPASVYGDFIGEHTLVDTDGNFGQNIEASLSHVMARHPGSPVAFLTCDVLPDADALQRLMALYRDHCPCDLWFPFVKITDPVRDLGASAWKPRYRIGPVAGEAPVEILPGHLLIADPDAISLEFCYKLFQLAYATRNRDVSYRRRVIVSSLVPFILARDLTSLLKLRIPDLSWNVIRGASVVGGGLKRGDLTLDTLQSTLRLVGVRADHRRRHPERKIIFTITDELSLALDVDTSEEADAVSERLQT
jgi:hypothetical protein